MASSHCDTSGHWPSGQPALHLVWLDRSAAGWTDQRLAGHVMILILWLRVRFRHAYNSAFAAFFGGIRRVQECFNQFWDNFV